MPLIVLPIEPRLTTRLDSFHCGASESDVDVAEFIRGVATNHNYSGLSRTYLAFENDPDNEVPAGYFSLYAGVLRTPRDFTKMFGGRPKDLPAVILGRLATHADHQKKGYGEELLAEALRITEDVAMHVGITIMALHAYKQPSTFYEKMGFLYANKNRWKSENVLDTEPMFYPIKRLLQ